MGRYSTGCKSANLFSYSAVWVFTVLPQRSSTTGGKNQRLIPGYRPVHFDSVVCIDPDFSGSFYYQATYSVNVTTICRTFRFNFSRLLLSEEMILSPIRNG